MTTGLRRSIAPPGRGGESWAGPNSSRANTAVSPSSRPDPRRGGQELAEAPAGGIVPVSRNASHEDKARLAVQAAVVKLLAAGRGSDELKPDSKVGLACRQWITELQVRSAWPRPPLRTQTIDKYEYQLARYAVFRGVGDGLRVSDLAGPRHSLRKWRVGGRRSSRSCLMGRYVGRTMSLTAAHLSASIAGSGESCSPLAPSWSRSIGKGKHKALNHWRVSPNRRWR